MSLIINGESYNGLNMLNSNAGDWNTGQIDFTTLFSVGSGVSNKFTYTSLGSNYILTLQSGNIGDYGFVVGDTINLVYLMYSVPAIYQSQTLTRTITYISGNSLYLDLPFTYAPSSAEHPSGRQFPTDGVVSGLLVVADKMPNSLEWQFNLTPNGSSSLSSVIDGEINRFELQNVASMSTGVPTAMNQLINKSGGLIKDVELTYLGAPGDYTRDFKITYKFWDWGVIQEGVSEPSYYASSSHLAPISKCIAYAQYGNPNGAQTKITSNTQANTGGFDENYNGGPNNYSVISIDFFDSLGNEITAPDNSGQSSFKAVINAPNQSNPASTYRLGIMWRPVDGNEYKNIDNYNIGQNLLLNAPDVDFIADGSVDATLRQGYSNSVGARWDLQNLKFSITGANELTVEGHLIPNNEAKLMFQNYGQGERRTTIWLSIANHTLGTGAQSDRVSLKLWDDDNYDAPTVGVQHPYVISESIIDHGGIIVNSPIPQITTEDDVLYRSLFRLEQGKLYEGVKARVWVYNSNTEEEFTLEEIFMSFSSVPFVSGKYEVSSLTSRGFNLPPSTDRNWISLTRESSLDIPGLYALKLEYGFLSRWEYWLEQANADNAFFDALLSFNGKNKDWQRFYLPPDWALRVSYYPTSDGVEDFNHFDFGVRPYDDEDAQTEWTFEVLSTGQTPTALVNNELHKVTAKTTWNSGSFSGYWFEMTVEDFESGNRWVISSVLAQGNIIANPLKPITTGGGLDVNLTSANVAELSCYIDTNLISSNNISLSVRAYSEDVPLPYEWDFLIKSTKDSIAAYSVARKLSVDSVYSGPLIRVRRNSDNTEMDIPHTYLAGEYVLDQDILIGFVGDQIGDFGYVVTRYDQSGVGAHATQTVLANQAPIVIDGAVVTDPDTGRPAMLCDGVNHYANCTWLTYSEMLSISVFNRIGTNDNCVGFGNNASFPYTMVWTGVTDIIYDGIGNIGLSNIHFTGQSQTGAQLNMMWRDSLNDIRMRLNGVLGTVINEINGASVGYQIERAQGGIMHKGYKSEDILFGRDRVNSETFIENNVNSFYSIF